MSQFEWKNWKYKSDENYAFVLLNISNKAPNFH